ncbi:hypothetical protein INT44_008033 [Umbelopsis vinacea]|uniref:Uncharacterized protein n=1 Tax=Umbelopsis vinacea TaxID=44442 RepID=A0A8H7PNU8_9FUNG|nr:hypothetical protein INT44_008033 [Umbelopsis vinacea]
MTDFAQRLHQREGQFRDLNSRIKELQWVDSQYRKAGAEKDRLTKVVGKLNKDLEELKKITRKEYEDTRKMKRVSFKSVKASMTGKMKATAAKEEQEYHDAFEREKACALQVERLTEELNQASMLRDRTQVSKDEIERLRDSLDQLYEDIFDGYHAQFRAEEKLSTDYTNLNEQYQTAARDLQRFRRCRSELEKSQALLTRCLQEMMVAFNYSSYDMFTREPVLDMMEYQALTHARTISMMAQQHLDAARTQVPEIPHPGSLNVIQGNYLINMMFDNVVVDMIMQAQIQQTYQMLTVTGTNLNRALSWVRQYIRYIEGCHRNLGQLVTATKRNLDEERYRIVSEGLEGTLEDTSRDMLPDEPPPIYEPPSESVETPPVAPPTNPHRDHLDLPQTEFDSSSIASGSPRISYAEPLPSNPPPSTGNLIDLDPVPSYTANTNNNPFRQ